jgi:hypothetical protein
MGRIFYGWVITGLSALANTLAWSVRSTFALFYVALLTHRMPDSSARAPGCDR